MSVDPVIARLIEDVANLKVDVGILKGAADANTKMLASRVEALEDEAEQKAAQERTDAEQASRREMADLRKKLESAEAETKKLRDERAVDQTAADVSGKGK